MKLDLRIAHLLSLQSLIGLLVAFALAATAFWAVRSEQIAADQVITAKDVTADILPPPLYLIELRLQLSQVVNGTITPAELQQDVDRLTREYQERAAYWQAHPPYGLEKQLLGPQHEAGLRFIEQAREVARLAQQGDTPALHEALKHAHAIYLEHRAGVDATVKAASAFAQASTLGAAEASKRAKQVQVGLLATGVVLLLVTGVWIRRRIIGPIGKAVDVAQRIADGDLSQKVVVDTSGEMGELLHALDGMQQSLCRMVSNIRMVTENINVASGEIAAGNQDLSMRTEQTASNLEETAASMEELNSTVRNSADAARQANQLSASAAEVATRGGQMVAQVVDSMAQIHHSSQKINDIIGVIDGIAFQTNILALNAAVEAARAGEQGRGFAVVAGEVRSLAQRSAEAAKEIKGLIGASVGSVETGSRQVADAGKTMQDIVASVQRVADIIGEISAASGEQSNGIDQVNTAVNQLDQMTQQNASLVEQSAAAAESLRQQAQQLDDTIKVFRVGGVTS